MFKFYKIFGASMSPALREGQFLIAEKLSYYFFSPKKGDVVVFKSFELGRELIKRVVARKGDNYFVAGDNFLKSTDSRHFGWIHRDAIVGKVVLY